MRLNGAVSIDIVPDDRRTSDLLARLRDDLGAAGFTVAALEALWGPDAAAALHRGERVPARRVLDARRVAPRGIRATSRRSRSSSCSALPVPASEAVHALPALGVDGAIELGLLGPIEPRRIARGRRPRRGASDVRDPTRGAAASVRALLDLRPYAFADARGDGHWWILSDLGEVALGHALGEQHVLGVGGASMTLRA